MLESFIFILTVVVSALFYEATALLAVIALAIIVLIVWVGWALKLGRL